MKGTLLLFLAMRNTQSHNLKVKNAFHRESNIEVLQDLLYYAFHNQSLTTPTTFAYKA